MRAEALSGGSRVTGFELPVLGAGSRTGEERPKEVGSPALFELSQASCGYRNRPVLSGLSFSLEAGETLCVLGANGVGKSTLFKSILKLLPLISGSLLIHGEDAGGWPRARMARCIGYIPQASAPAFSYSVMDVVLMGRCAHLGSLESPSETDEELACAALEDMGITRLMNRSFLELSGGERQLALIARALVQQPEIMIMDEPTAALDFGNQQMVLEQILALSQQGIGVIMASHFPDHALQYAQSVLMLKNGCVHAAGQPDEAITREALQQLYGVEVEIVDSGLYARSTGREIRTCIPLH